MEKSITNEFQLFKFSFENAIDAIFWINIDGKIIYANKSALQSLGYSRSELLVRSVHDIDPNFQKEDWAAHWKKLEKSRGATFESLHKKKNGMIFPVEIRVNHLEVDHTAFHCAFVRDITESKKAEKLLMDNEERFRRTLDVTSDGMWDRDLQTGAVYYGSNYAAALGYSEEDFLSGNVTWRHLLHPDDKELAIEAVNNHLQGKTEKYSAEFRLRNCNNGWQWMLAKGKVIEKDEKER
ncbi:MAG: PAS domain S-box protein, partial [Bacteroidetes bacterium]|nr:PAS domain S-box protein [Bacteroidota bacterium]